MSGGGFGDLALDMVAFSILKHLTEKYDAYQVLDDEALVLPQLRNIADFAGMFFKAFPTVDLKPLMTYVLNRMKRNQCHETTVLSKILHLMFGWKDDLANYQPLERLAAGLRLKLDLADSAHLFLENRMARESLGSLFGAEAGRTADQEGKVHLSLAFRMMSHLAQQTQYIINEDKSENLTLIQNNFDKLHHLFLQFVDTTYFLTSDSHSPGGDRSKYCKVVPSQLHSPDILATQYRLPYQYSFHILRKATKSIYKLSEQEFDDLVVNYASIFDKSFENRITLCT